MIYKDITHGLVRVLDKIPARTRRSLKLITSCCEKHDYRFSIRGELCLGTSQNAIELYLAIGVDHHDLSVTVLDTHHQEKHIRVSCRS
jgi:hypothetical protein